jgi:hypothetical protein
MRRRTKGENVRTILGKKNNRKERKVESVLRI